MLLGLVLVALAACSWGTTGSAMTLLAREGTSSPFLVVTGTAMLLAGPRSLDRLPEGFVPGVISALGAGLSYAVYTLTAKGLLARAAPLPLAAATFTLAAALLTPVLLLEREIMRPLAAGWPLLLYLALVPTAVAYLLFGAGLKRVPVTAAGIATLLEPLTASALGVLAFGERLGAWGW